MGSTAVPFLSGQSAQPQTRARTRRLSTMWWRSTLLYLHSTNQRSCLGAAEMGQATRRELAPACDSAFE
jgi:hypothetical protein